MSLDLQLRNSDFETENQGVWSVEKTSEEDSLIASAVLYSFAFGFMVASEIYILERIIPHVCGTPHLCSNHSEYLAYEAGAMLAGVVVGVLLWYDDKKSSRDM